MVDSYSKRFLQRLKQDAKPWARDNIGLAGVLAVAPIIVIFLRNHAYPVDWVLVRTTAMIYVVVFLVYLVFQAIRVPAKLDQDRIDQIRNLESERDSANSRKDALLAGPVFEGFAYRFFVGPSNGKSMALARATQSLFNALNGEIPFSLDMDILAEVFVENISPGVRQIVAVEMWLEANGEREKLSRIDDLSRYRLAIRSLPSQKSSGIPTTTSYDALVSLYPRLTDNAPLQKGHKAEGWLLFRLPNAKLSLLENEKAKFTLVLFDSS